MRRQRERAVPSQWFRVRQLSDGSFEVSYPNESSEGCPLQGRYAQLPQWIWQAVALLRLTKAGTYWPDLGERENDSTFIILRSAKLRRAE